MAHAVTYLAGSARRRVGARVLVRNAAGEVLLVKPGYQRYPAGDWFRLPGGGARPDEMPHAAALRGFVEETGLAGVRLGALLIVDYVPAGVSTGSREGISLVFDGGVVEPQAQVRLPQPLGGEAAELVAWRFVAEGELDQYCQPYQAHRIREALAAARNPAERGYRVAGRAV